MSTELEDDLIRVLGAVANRAPEPDPDFAAMVAGRRRHRRRVRRTATAALSALAAAIIAIPVAVTLHGDGGQVGQPSRSTIDIGSARPAEQVWPDAVVRLPAALPDGRTLHAVARLDDDRFMIAPTGGPDPYSFPAVYNARTRETTELMTATAPSGVSGYGFGGVVPGMIAGRQLAWVAAGRIGGSIANHGYYEVWTAPAAGGPAVRRAVFDLPGEVSVVQPFGDGDVLYASVTPFGPSGGQSRIYRLPAGGNPQLVPGSEGWSSADLGNWAAQRSNGSEPSTPGARIPSEAAVSTFWNIETGERRTRPRLPGITGLWCLPEICTGTASDGPVLYRFDDASTFRLTDRAPASTGSHSPAVDAIRFAIPSTFGGRRFVGMWWSSKGVVVDLKTGSAATVIGFSHQLPPLSRAGGEQQVLDLSRIP